MAKNNQTPQDDENVDLVHRELIEEEDIDISKLPRNIQQLIKQFDGLEESYDETEESFTELQELDAKIADAIQTFIEDDIDDDDQNNQSNQNQMKEKQKNDEAEAKAKADAKAEADAKAKADADKAEADRILAEEAYKKSPEALVEKIKAKLRDNRISNEDLSALIGVDEADEDNYKIGSLTLKRVYLGDGVYEVKS